MAAGRIAGASPGRTSSARPDGKEFGDARSATFEHGQQNNAAQRHRPTRVRCRFAILVRLSSFWRMQSVMRGSKVDDAGWKHGRFSPCGSAANHSGPCALLTPNLDLHETPSACASYLRSTGEGHLLLCSACKP
jgi:hypothetical protein